MTPQERIESLAAARGGVATYPAPVRENVTPEPKTGPEHRKPPMSWQNVPDRWNGPRKYLMQSELRVVAWLICRCLGPEWRKVVSEHRGCYLVHVSGLRLSLQHVWNNPDRYRISPNDCRLRRDSPVPSEITVAASRTPAAIAADIQRRILQPGAIAGYLACNDNDLKRRVRDNQRRLNVLSIGREFGGQLKQERRWSSCSYPETEATYVSNCCVSASETYQDRFCLSVESKDINKLRRIAAFIKELDS